MIFFLEESAVLLGANEHLEFQKTPLGTTETHGL